MTFKALNLDFYGTLVDWLPIWVDVSNQIVTHNDIGLTAHQFALAWRGIQRDKLSNKEYTPYKQNICEALQLLSEKYSFENRSYEEKLFGKWIDIRPFPETNDVLRKFRRSYVLAICSNSSRDLYQMSVRDIGTKFDTILISDETKVNKPHLGMYERAISELGVNRQEILHVASSQMDLSGATLAGLTVCWINRLDESRKEGVPAPEYEVSTLDQILDIL